MAKKKNELNISGKIPTRKPINIIGRPILKLSDISVWVIRPEDMVYLHFQFINVKVFRGQLTIYNNQRPAY